MKRICWLTLVLMKTMSVPMLAQTQQCEPPEWSIFHVALAA